MPTDTRRLPIPEESKTPFAFEKIERQSPQLVNESGQRQDNRKCHQSRPLFVKAGVVSQAKGSAYIELEKTKVICAVYGPREVTKREEFSMKGQLYCEMKFATFARPYRSSHQQDSTEKDLSAVLREALEPAVCLDKFPKARMDVFVTVLEDNGGALAAAISCASVALAHGGIEMYDLVAGASLRQYGDVSLLDPSDSEQYSPQLNEKTANNGSITVGFMPSIHQVSALVQNGVLDSTVAQQGIKLLIEACQRVYPVLQQCLLNTLKQRLKDNC